MDLNFDPYDIENYLEQFDFLEEDHFGIEVHLNL